ncbi:MAG: hypothetical protein ACLFQ9_05380 [Desulfobacterales bacterium]
MAAGLKLHMPRRGMRAVHDMEELEWVFEICRSAAESAFGSGKRSWGEAEAVLKPV